MKDGIYICFNTLTNRYERTFSAESDKQASYAFKFSGGSIPTYKYLELCKIAEVDITNGIVIPLPAPLRIGKFVEDESSPAINSIEKKALESEVETVK